MKNKHVLFGLLTLIVTGSSLSFAASGIFRQGKYDQIKEQKNKASNNNDKKHSNQKVSSSLGLYWTELGPDNFGGRTRAILLDKNNPNIIYAGGVSGGLWKSTTSGTSWTKINDLDSNLAISCITQGVDGAIYVGTGEIFAIHKGSANGSTGFIGKGIYKSTDGINFLLLPLTKPSKANDTTVAWAFVNKLACDPNQNRIYAATNKGLRRSDNGGAWIPVQFASISDTNQITTDVKVGTDGTVVTSYGNKCWISPNGNDGTFTCHSSSTAGDLPINGITRVEFAIAPSNSNYIYASMAGNGGNLAGIYRSTNKGSSWTNIGHSGSADFQPFINNTIPSINGILNNVIIVNPTDTNNIFVGGASLWEWHKGEEWVQKSVTTPYDVYGINTNEQYLHSGLHCIAYNLANGNMFFADNGGISMSSDGGNSFHTININYSTVQCNSISCSPYGWVMAGTQNNGTMFFPLSGSFPKHTYNIFDGDCGWNTFSYINPKAFFATTSYAGTSRSPDYGETFYDNSSFFSTRILALGTGATGSPGLSGFPAAFTTPLLLWENFNDTYSCDSILITVDSVSNELLGKGTTIDSSGIFIGKTNFTGTLVKNKQDGASIVPGTIYIINGTSVSVNDNGSGQFMNDATGSIDYNTGAYDITFNSAPHLGTSILVSYKIKYNINSVIHIKSGNSPGTFDYTTQTTLEPGDSIKIQDVIQAKFYIGFNNSIWMTKKALNFTIIPQWFQIASTSGTTQCMALSHDGNYLFVGSATGKLYRLSNLRKAQDSLTSDIGTVAKPNINCVISTANISFSAASGRAITSISVDPSDPNKVVVTLGGYNQSTYIYYSTNATDSAPVFNLKQGNLKAMPVYASLIPMFNSGTVIIGTEYGVYATTDIANASPNWTEENTGMAHVPVYMIIQQQNNYWNSNCQVYNYGTIYIATHGRGVFGCQNFSSINEPPNSGNSNSVKNYLSVSIYPDPVINNATISFNLPNRSNVELNVYNINGKLVNTINLANLAKGNHVYTLDCSAILKGTYIIQVLSGKESATAKFVKM
ncbi:MAG: T9SS type A sorting domain-containing protein [Bacteroidales bacterium]